MPPVDIEKKRKRGKEPLVTKDQRLFAFKSLIQNKSLSCAFR